MSSAEAFLSRLIRALERAGVPHMLAGSFASGIHGVPRSTRDVDLIIDPTVATLDRFLAVLGGEEFYVNPSVARDELAHRGQFNVIDIATSWKADLIFRRNRPFDRVEFERRAPEKLLGVTVFVASPEDTVLAKLEWAKLGGGDQQLRDVHGIIQVQGEMLDRAYIDSWLDDLGIRDLWELVLRG